MRLAARLAARIDALLVRERVRNYSLIILVMGSLAIVANAALGGFPQAVSGDVVFPDFLAHWTGGRLVLLGRAPELYDPVAQSAVQVEAVGSTKGLAWFVSPPITALLFVPFAALPYGWGSLVWTAVSVATLALALNLVGPLLRRRSSDHRLFTLLVWSTPAVFELVGSGQDTAVALLLVVVALRLLGTGRETSAGVVLAAGVYKPHLFVLVPIVLLLQGRYRALLALAAASAGLVLASLPVVGVQAWLGWVGALASPLYGDQVQTSQTWKMQSVSALNTALGLPTGLSYTVLLVGVAAFAWTAWRFRHDGEHVWGLALLTTIVFSPHAMLYDLVLLVPVLVYFHAHHGTRAARLLAVLTCILLWSVPLRYGAAAADPRWQVLSAPWSALPLFGLWLLLTRSHATPEQPDGARAAPAGRSAERAGS